MNDPLFQTVKFNCDVSDARFWGFFSICGLLMRYRDLYRSEAGLSPWADIKREAISKWIGQKEARWPELEQQEFRPILIKGRTFQPFDVVGINRALEKQGLIYGAGYGMYLKPTFFLAELCSVREVSGLTVYTSSAERVRDLFTSPGMLQEKTVFLRLEPLIVLLTYKFSELNSRRNSALEDAFAHYGFRQRQLIDETFEKRMRETAERFAEVLLRHEVAEEREEVRGWKDILSAAGDRNAEHYLRAVKDLIADTSVHGPLKTIVETKDRAALGLQVALMEGYRRALFPELRDAHQEFLRTDRWDVIEAARSAGFERFTAEREKIATLYRENGGEDFRTRLKAVLPGKEDLGGT